MGWTAETRNKKQKKMIQIYVKVNGWKVTPMEVNLTDDKVEDVTKRIPNSEGGCVTLHGRVLKRSEKLKSCEVTDGCTIQVASRLRGGGRNKNKTTGERKKKFPKKEEQNDQSTKEKNLLEADMVADMLEGEDGARKSDAGDGRRADGENVEDVKTQRCGGVGRRPRDGDRRNQEVRAGAEAEKGGSARGRDRKSGEAKEGG